MADSNFNLVISNPSNLSNGTMSFDDVKSSGGSGLEDGMMLRITNVYVVQFAKPGEQPASDARRHIVFDIIEARSGQPIVVHSKSGDSRTRLWLSSWSPAKQKRDSNMRPVVKDGTFDENITSLIAAGGDVYAGLQPLFSTNFGTRVLRVRRKYYSGINRYGDVQTMSIVCLDYVEANTVGVQAGVPAFTVPATV